MPTEWEWVQHFHFMRPAWALILIPWVFIFVVMNRRQSGDDRFAGIIAPHLLQHLRLARFQSRWANPRSFTAIILSLLLIVLMGPSWRQQPSPLSEDESALVVLLDVSHSMGQGDVQPSRLARAKQKIADLLALRPDKRAALIVYAGSAHTVLTLTADRQILGNYLAAISGDIMPRDGKFPEYALPRVDQVLRQTTAPATVVLFTDGAGADSAAAFAEYFAQHQHQLLILGVGSSQADEGSIPLDTATLEQLAEAGGGTLFELSVDDSDVRRINRRVDNHYVVLDNQALPWLDSGYPLIFPAMALFLMWFRRGWTLTWSWLLLPWLLLPAAETTTAQEMREAVQPVEVADKPERHWFADLWLTPDQQGRLLMQWGHYTEAAARFQHPLWKGMAHYYAEDFMVAAEYFSRSDSDDALFNEANARAHARDYLRALARYDRLLERNPEYPGASANRQRVQELVDEIERMSESQQEEAGVSSEEKQLGGDDAIPAEGAEKLDWRQAELKQLSADDILQDPATADMWMRGVQQDPATFLSIKFGMQLQQQEGEQ
jgi:Ca-activated chloride channel family protein